MQEFWHACVPLFVAFDGIGVLPVFWGLSHGLNARQRRTAVTEAVVTSGLVAVAFLLVSRTIFVLMGLKLADIMIAGGAILFVLALRDTLLPEKLAGTYPSPGVVPLGVPLLAGPAVLTMVLLLRDRYGWPVTLAALVANMGIIWAILRSSGWLMQRLGHQGAQVISKITSLILTAFGVMLVREGITLLVH